MTTPPPLPTSVTVTAVARSSPWPLVVLVLGLAAICGIAVAYMPPEHLDHALDKIGSGVSWFVADPAGAVAAIAGLAGAIVTVLVLLHITPPGWLVAITTVGKPKRIPPGASTLLVLVVTGMSISGCGAALSATTLATGMAIVTVAKDATCTIAEELCTRNDPQCGSSACHVFHDGCALLSPSSPIQVACMVPATPTPVVPPPVVMTLPIPAVRLDHQVLDRRPLRDHARVRT